MDKTTATAGPVEFSGEMGNQKTSLGHQYLPSTSSQADEKTIGAGENYERTANEIENLGDFPLLTEDVKVPSPVSVDGNKSPSETTVHELVQPAASERGGDEVKDCQKISREIRYFLNRMNYEQTLIEAYDNEGWNAKRMEKIRPEKELERARAEILRCKMKIRTAFQNLDLIPKGKKLDGSLFDSEGRISNEDIFCGTCGTGDVTLNNDIILCDGSCDRAFHQNCLNPPLLTEHIPAGEQAWLCPACDCKLDLMDKINQLQGSNLSISDSWEKVFLEAAALPPAGYVQNDPCDDLPSDDSEDGDFDPDLGQDHEQHHADGQEERLSDEEDGDEGSGSDELNFLTYDDSEDVALPVSGRRRVPRVDYRKLNDEFFGEAWYESSDSEEWYGSSDGEEWSGEHIEKRPSSRKCPRKRKAANQQLMSDEPAPLKAQQSSNPDALVGYLNEQYALNHIPKRARSRRNWNLMVAPRQDSDTDTVMEEHEGCENKAGDEEMASGNLNNEGVKQHSPAEQDIHAAGAGEDSKMHDR
ncbi:hypothetical protein GUJ93_ZPchr0005g15185 [Zizania palustris]|uniref:PHD-type domain-containing protein n=1 Tax=Zizania palustris TaxID=103762 RepID=A0A8J5SWA6_ZIZPA|nr:hypothetical protein GUJ93_ZPchr0005g15185 [Zizania palustris]